MNITPYMAPEVQILSQVSTKSDAYSFGVLLIELLNGKKSFSKEGKCSTLWIYQMGQKILCGRSI